MPAREGDTIYRIQRLMAGKSSDNLLAIERFIIGAPLLAKGDAVTDLIDQCERHKAAVLGESDLKIGRAVIAHDYDDCIRMLNYLRSYIVDREARIVNKSPI